jgi:hypothetical protein
MNLMLLRLFQGQVAEQCRYLLLSAQRVNLALSSDGDIWFDLQNLLAAGANVAKLLWGKNPTITAQRAPLRASLGIDDASPLKQRGMRNHYEHIDERLDDWDRLSKHHNHVSRIIGPPDAIAGVDEIDLFRRFDPATATALFWGDTFDIQALVTEAERLLPIATAEAGKPHWEPSSPSDAGGGQ